MKENGLFSQLEAERKVLVFGHRGFSEEYPENTMISFSKAAENPLVDAVELDVHLCKTGEVVISHDFSLKRTAGIDREIEDLTLDELRGIDVGSFKGPEFSDCRIPLLSELFSTFGNRFIYDVELKVKAGKVNRELSTKVVSLIREFHLEDRVLVSSFNPLALRAFRCECLRNRMPIPTADIFDHSEYIPRLLWNGFGHFISLSSYQKPGHKLVDSAFLRSHGRLPVMAWTVNTREDAERLLAFNSDRMRVFGLIGNDPEMLAETVNRFSF